MAHRTFVGRRALLAIFLLLGAGTALSAQGAPTEHLILASDGAAGDILGTQVATSGQVTAVTQVDWSNWQNEVGKVYVYEGCGTFQEFQLQPSGAVPADVFAFSVDTDGDVIVVGAPESVTLAKDGVGGPGMAYVFRRDAMGWQEEAVLTASNGILEDFFGWDVAVYGDLIAVGAPGVNNTTGLTYLFRHE